MKNNTESSRQLLLLSLFLFSVLGVNSLLLMAHADVSELPESFKNTSLWWAGNHISDDDFLTSIKFLVENKIIDPKITKPDEIKPIPSWLKTPLKWWGMGLITDYDVSKNLEYLISKNIMQIESPIKSYSVYESFGITMEIIECARSTPGLYVDMGVKITNKNADTMNVDVIYQLLDSHKNVIDIKERVIYDVGSSDVEYESIEMNGSDLFDSCKVEIRRAWVN